MIAPTRAAPRSFGNGVAPPQSRTASLDYIFKGDAPEGAFDFDEPSPRQPEQFAFDGEGREPSALVPQGKAVNSARYTAQLRGSRRRPSVDRQYSASQSSTSRGQGRPVRTGAGSGRLRQAPSRAPSGVMTMEEQAACCLAVQVRLPVFGWMPINLAGRVLLGGSRLHADPLSILLLQFCYWDASSLSLNALDVLGIRHVIYRNFQLWEAVSIAGLDVSDLIARSICLVDLVAVLSFAISEEVLIMIDFSLVAEV